jgi:hypothetical protein
MLLHLYNRYHLKEDENLQDLNNQVMWMVIQQKHPNVNAKQIETKQK